MEDEDLDLSDCWEEKAARLAIAGRDLTALPPAVIAQYAARAKVLDLSYNEFSSFESFSEFRALDSLVLDNNNFSSVEALPALPSLHTLSLNANRIAELDRFLSLLHRSMPNLTYLSLLKNPACPNYFVGKDDDDYRRYRYFVLWKHPGLNFLDSSPVTDFERKEAKRVGQFCGTVARADSVVQTKEVDKSWQQIRGIPDEAGETRQGANFGLSRYRYLGKHSEGNRFIRDSEL